jgi:hypothetical protein
MSSESEPLVLGLKTSVVDSICAVFSAYSEIERAMLYGSRAKEWACRSITAIRNKE